jgi:hypothetical protein
MVALGRHDVIGDAEQPLDGDVDRGFFARFAHCARLERLERLDTSTEDAPRTRFGRSAPQRQEDALAVLVNDHDPDTNAWYRG